MLLLRLRPDGEKCGPISWTMQKNQSDCLYQYSSLFFEHYNLIILYDWVPGRYSVGLRTRAGHKAFVLNQALARVGSIS